MLLSTLLLTLFPTVYAVASKPPKCLNSGTEEAINLALKTGGKATTVTLCPGSVHRLNSTILFTANRQTLTTEGDVKGKQRALIIVEGAEQSTAIKADCVECSGATIRSLVVDGNRPQLLRAAGLGGALLELGNAESQTVRDCKLYEPRGWSALHFREGDRKQCRKAHVVDNEIGPCGEEWDDDYDGILESAILPWGNPRADGISLACQESLIERNIVYDTTDGAIVLFGSSGTEVRNNEIYARTRVVLGGINLVDYEPWAGDYFGVTVHDNHVHALGRYLKVGIVIGPSSWSDDTETTVHSASITDNTFHGQYFGYGIVVSSATSFTVLRNTVDDTAGFSGVTGARCPKAPENGKPTAFLINRGSARGTFQEDFVNGEVQHIICLNPSDVNGIPYKPWRFRDSPLKPLSTDADSETDQASSGTFDSRLAEALVNYQLNLLNAMGTINDRIERVNRPKETDENEKRGKTGYREIDNMADKLGLLERGEKGLHRELDAIQAEMEGLSSRMKKSAEDNKPLLQGVFQSVAGLKASSQAGRSEPSGEIGDFGVGNFTGVGNITGGLSMGSIAALAGSGAIVWAALTVVRRWRGSRRKHAKLV